jgi:SAM-dependent methyltransferase
MALRGVPTVFNQRLLRKRLACAARSKGADNFLMRRIAEDIASRLGLIKREFQLCALFGEYSDYMAPALEGLPNLGRMISIGRIDAQAHAKHSCQILATEEHLPLANQSLNLAISPLTLQFVNDLPGALIQIKRSLKPDGVFIAAFLGGDSLCELRDALLSAEIDITGGASPRIHPRVDIRDLGALLQRAGFALPVVDSDRITVTYQSALHLMLDLRALGLTNILTQGAGAVLNRRVLARLEEVYKERYPAAGNRINATFEIIYLTGWAPHESQQTPLRPGSAKARLADALKTQEISISDDPVE